MEKTDNRGGLKLVLGIIILVALIVGLVIALSSCGGDDGDVAEEPPVKDAVVDEADLDDANEPSTTGGSINGGGSNGTNGGANDSAGTDIAAPDENASLEEWIAYLRDYDKNVESGVEGATDDFKDMIDQVGGSMSNGDYGEGVDQFGSGMKDYLSGIIGSLTP